MCLYGKAGKQHRSWFKGQRADEMIEIVEKKEWKKLEAESRKHRETWTESCLLGLAALHSFGPPMRLFSSFMSQKEAWLKTKGYTSQSPGPRS